MKKFLAALLTLAMVMSLAACGSSKPAEAPAPAPAQTAPAAPEKAPEPAKPAEPEKKPEEKAEPAKIELPDSETVDIEFTLKNKEELGLINSLKIVPTGDNGAEAENLLAEPGKGTIQVAGTIPTTEYYDILVEFEQANVKLVGVPYGFDKVSLKDGGASISNDAAGIEYVTSMDGGRCKSSEFKFQEFDPAAAGEAGAPAGETIEMKFTLKNKENLGDIKSLKIVPHGADAAAAESLIAEPVSSSVEVKGTVEAAEFYDVVVEFEQGTKVLEGVPAEFDKISIKDGGASIANEAADVKYVVNMNGDKCNSDGFKFK